MAFCVITVFVSTREIARIPPRHPPSLLWRWANLRRSEKPPPKKQKPHCIFPQVSVANNSDVRFPKGIWLERRIGKPRFLRENTSWWKYDVSAGCRRDASWTCGEGQIAFVPLLIKSPVIMVPQRMSGGGMNEERFRCGIDLYKCRQHLSHISQSQGVVGRLCNDHGDGCDLIRGVFWVFFFFPPRSQSSAVRLASNRESRSSKGWRIVHHSCCYATL